MLDITGIYSLRVETALDKCFGTVILVDDKFYGGNDMIAMWGKYYVKDHKFIATIQTRQHNYGISLLKEKEKIKMKGEITNYIIEGKFLCTGTLRRVDFKLIKFAEINNMHGKIKNFVK